MTPVIPFLLSVYEQQEADKLTVLKVLTAFSFHNKISPTERILYQLVFDSENPEYSFYTSIIISNLSATQKALVLRTGILSTLQSIEYDSELNDHYINFLNDHFLEDHFELPEEVTNPNSLKDIVSAIESGELLLYDFYSDTNDLFNLCCDLLPTADREDLTILVKFIFARSFCSSFANSPTRSDPSF